MPATQNLHPVSRIPLIRFNPFNPETRIGYYLPTACPVKLSVFNLLGQNVGILFDGYQRAGIQALIGDG
ncbi:MAG: hypothetical protein WCE90_02820 [Candidatus Zixiibacteriota bacterium]